MKTIAFAGSNSSQSINQELINYVNEQFQGDIELIKLTDYELPMFSEDTEKRGYPEKLYSLHERLRMADKLIISTPEHNGNLPAFFKNTLDWLSRLDFSFLKGKKVFVMSTSAGKQGGKSALTILRNTLPFFGADIQGEFPFVEFQKNFKNGEIINLKQQEELIERLNSFIPNRKVRVT